MEKYTTIDEFIRALDEEQRDQVTLLRTVIRNAYPELTEHIKWNSLSYMLNESDRITFSVRPKLPIAIVLHMGTTRPENKKSKPVMDDSSGLIEWKSDIRGVISFTDLDDIKAKKSQFIRTVGNWLTIAA